MLAELQQPGARLVYQAAEHRREAVERAAGAPAGRQRELLHGRFACVLGAVC